MVPIRQNLANKANYGGSRNTSKIKYICIHYTANDGDKAASNGNYFKNHVVTASAHYFVDDNEIIQSVPDNRVAYAVGGKKLAGGGGRLHGKATNTNSISIELCDVVKNGVVYPSQKTVSNAVELTKQLMKKYNIPVSNVIRHYDVTGKKCPAYWVDDTAWNREFIGRLTGATSVPTPKKSEETNPGNGVIAAGQKHANDFTGHVIKIDGFRGPQTREQAVRVVQHALNLDYKANLVEDGQWGSKTDKAFGKHYVKVGEKQWLVTAAEILCALAARDPNGVEYPGSFGGGLQNAAGSSKLTRDWFKIMCS